MQCVKDSDNENKCVISAVEESVRNDKFMS